MFREVFSLSVLLLLGTGSLAQDFQGAFEVSSNSPDGPNFKTLQKELNLNRNIWKHKVGSASYRMTITRQCFCLPDSLGPFTLTVVDNEITAAEPNNDFSDGLPTIEGLFDLIQEAINSKVAELTVSYDATLGFPTSVFIDRDFRIADEEIGYEVSDVIILSFPNPGKPTCSFAPVRPNAIRNRLSAKTNRNGFSFSRYILALRRWNNYAEKNNCSYEYILTRSCFCSEEFRGPFVITVQNKVVVNAVFENSGSSVPASILDKLPTISDLFDIIFDEANNADSVKIDYDFSTGVPTSAFFDRIKGAIDDEITYLAELL